MRSATAVAIVVAFMVAGCGQTRRASPPSTVGRHAIRQRVKRVVRRRPHPTSTAVPILMYHVIDSPPPGSAVPRAVRVARSEFEGQVRWLAAHGYHAVTLDHVYDAWKVGAQLPHKPVVFTFDDGYVEDLAAALPVLHARNWPGVLFLHIGNLDPPRVHALRRAHWEIDAHTFRHLDVTTLSARDLRREIAGSRRWIRRVFHVPCDFFAYPSGRYDPAAVAEVRDAGYRGAVTRDPGLASPRDGMFTLKRVRVNGGEGVTGLAAALG